jgi:hypothetical protein
MAPQDICLAWPQSILSGRAAIHHTNRQPDVFPTFLSMPLGNGQLEEMEAVEAREACPNNRGTD